MRIVADGIRLQVTEQRVLPHIVQHLRRCVQIRLDDACWQFCSGNDLLALSTQKKLAARAFL